MKYTITITYADGTVLPYNGIHLDELIAAARAVVESAYQKMPPYGGTLEKLADALGMKRPDLTP